MILVDSFCLEMHCEIGKYSCLGLGYIFPTAMNLFFDCHCLQLWFENHVLLSIWLPPCFLELFILWQNATVNVVYMKIYVISSKMWNDLNRIESSVCCSYVFENFFWNNLTLDFYVIILFSFFGTTKLFRWHSANSTSECIWFLHSGLWVSIWFLYYRKKSNW